MHPIVGVGGRLHSRDAHQSAESSTDVEQLCIAVAVLSTLCASDEVPPAVRAQLRARLRGPIAQLHRASGFAAIALDGPDPQVAATDILGPLVDLAAALVRLAPDIVTADR